MGIAFIDRDPSPSEVERLRLVLSTYQDGSGQLVSKDGQTLPGWRDFERTIAAVFGGKAQENKYIFDVLLPDLTRPGIFSGISCKMRRTLDDTRKTGRVTLELSNSAGKFWKALSDYGLHQQNYKSNPQIAGKALIALVERWHAEVSIQKGGSVDLSKSFYLALSWNKFGEYQLFKFPISLPMPETLQWDFPDVAESDGSQRAGRRLRGKDNLGILFEWYGESGAQLKYYPNVENALWKSDTFRLEILPQDSIIQHSIMAKAKFYFPEHWVATSKEDEEK